MRVSLARSLIGNDRYQEAITLLSKAIPDEKRPDIRNYMRGWLGAAMLQNGDLVGSEQIFRSVMQEQTETDPWTFLPAQQRLAQSLIRQGQLAEAANMMANVEQKAPAAFGADNPRLTELAMERAELHLAQGDHQRVIDVLTPIIADYTKRYGADAKPVRQATLWLVKAQAMQTKREASANP
jgi:tetratricopeptide (TPR) repeat protein